MAWVGHVARTGELISESQFWSETCKRRDQLELLGVDNIEADLKDTGYEGVNWIELINDRIHWLENVETLMNLQADNFFIVWIRPSFTVDGAVFLSFP